VTKLIANVRRRRERDVHVLGARMAPSATRPVLNLPLKMRLQIHSLVQDLFVAPSLLPPRVVAFVALEHDSGASGWVCAHAGDTLAAAAGTSVCLVDADFHTASLHAHLGARNGAGFADMLHEQQRPATDFAARAAERLWVVPAGSCPDKGSEALASNGAQARLAELRMRFQHVFISSPPVGEDGVAAVIGRSTDGVVLVLHANKTRRDYARHVKEEFEALGVRVLAAILLDPDSAPEALVTNRPSNAG
jgi:Mrp family chromosome partitioning ATPase